MHLNELVNKYEEMSSQNKSLYFDADQIEAIAYSYESRDDFNEALSVVNFGLSLHPLNSSLILLKAKYLLFLDYVEEAGRIIVTISDESEETMLVKIEYEFAKGNNEKGYFLLYNQLNNPEISWEFCMDAINILWGYSPYEEIIRFIYKAIEKHPDNLDLKCELATIYKDNSDEQKAIILYNEILDADPYKINIWFELARAYYQIRNYEKALESCDFAIAISDDNKEISCFRGYCLYELENYLEALDVFKEYEEYSSKDNSVFDYIADCYSKLDMTPKAIEYIESTLIKNPDNPHLLFHLAFYYQDLGNTPKAREILDHCIELDNNNPEYYKLKADIFQQESDFENALLFFKKVIEKNPSYDVLAQMGDCCEKLDDIDTAIDYYIQAIQLRPNDIRIMFRLILAYYSINEPDKAIELSHQIATE